MTAPLNPYRRHRTSYTSIAIKNGIDPVEGRQYGGPGGGASSNTNFAPPPKPKAATPLYYILPP